MNSYVTGHILVLVGALVFSSCSGLDLFSLDKKPPERKTEKSSESSVTSDEVSGEDMLIADEAQPLNGAFLACGYVGSQDDVLVAERQDQGTVEVACGAYDQASNKLVRNYTLSFETILIDGSEPTPLANSFENDSAYHIVTDVPVRSLDKGALLVKAQTRTPKGELQKTFRFADLEIFNGKLPDGILTEDRIESWDQFASLVEQTYTLPGNLGSLINSTRNRTPPSSGDEDEDEDGFDLQGATGSMGFLNAFIGAADQLGMGQVILTAEELCSQDDKIGDKAKGMNILRSVLQGIFGNIMGAIETGTQNQKLPFPFDPQTMTIGTNEQSCFLDTDTSASERPLGSIESDVVDYFRPEGGQMGCGVIVMKGITGEGLDDIIPGASGKLVAFIARDISDSQFLALERFAASQEERVSTCEYSEEVQNQISNRDQ